MLRALLLASSIVVGLTLFARGGHGHGAGESTVQEVVDQDAARAASTGHESTGVATDGEQAAPDQDALDDSAGGCRSSGADRSHKVILLLALLLAVCMRNRHR